MSKYAEVTAKIQDVTEKNAFFRFITSFTPMMFCYGIFLFLYEMKFLRDIVPIVHPLFIAWAGLVAAYSLFIKRDFKEITGWKLIAVFTVSTFVTAIVHFSVSPISNIKALILTLLPLYAFLPAFVSTPKENRKSQFLKILIGSAGVMFLFTLTALILYFLRINTIVEFAGIAEHIGIRLYDPNANDHVYILYGLFRDTNHAATYSVFFCLFGLLLFTECKKGLFKKSITNTIGKIFGIASAVVQFIYFPLANSRGAWLSLLLILFSISFIFFVVRKKEEHTSFKTSVLSLLKSSVTVLVCYCLIFSCRWVSTTASFSISKIFADHILKTPQSSNSQTVPDNSQTVPDIDDSQTVDYSKGSFFAGAGRLEIWSNGLKIFVKHPILGVNFNNIAHYAKQVVPEHKLAEGGALHNSYLDLLISYGILGFLPLIIFFGYSVINILKKIFKERSVNTTTLIILGMALFLACNSFFLSNLFINTTAMYFILLVSAGYIISNTKD